MTILWGANDASNSHQHVPLEEYKENLKKIIQFFRNSFHTKIILITPPPIDAEAWGRGDRDNSITRLYAKAVLELSKEIDLPCVGTCLF